jgi:hypothetical protein
VSITCREHAVLQVGAKAAEGHAGGDEIAST